ncbi:porin [Cupriavidus oxalaticus]|uniref:porin n=1 Tax=Cupriavidus oxalaticus TaxID=96344 RepID=A0A375FM54_9BURK|nr:porin [Cupriavidus oxalaticus]QRQ85838.1 porin [Cupriavidus oxalaticus]QRQ95836.1 porin [Cupriavidus oxalaticus]WQD84514.1 porin [Cupriavidus oxalaticus]SPC06566.1 putative PORIN [Cupriavidus oxalaticus]SPC12452.1 Porin, Gram-negative type [Cupriavidus oxalaticus]
MKYARFAAASAGVLAVVPLLASAQSVTLYGVVDTGVEYVSNVGANGQGLVRMPNQTATVPSRWGLRGTEDLGGGLKSIFVLESGFSPDSGVSNQGGRLFGRQALVGLSNQYGQVSFGRQYTMLFWATLDSDILGPNVYGSGSLDSYLPNSRADNAVAYKGTFGGLTIGGTYSLGRDAVNAGPSPAGTNCAGENPADKKACREWSALIGYSTKTWGVNAAYDSLRGGPGAFGGLTNSNLTDDRLSLSGYMILERAKVGAGWIRRDNEGSPTPVSDLYYGGVAYDITPAFTLAGQVYYLKYHGSDNKATLFALRGMYSFSKRTSVYATAGFIDNGGQLAMSVSGGAPGSSPKPGANQFGTMVGIKHIF